MVISYSIYVNHLKVNLSRFEPQKKSNNSKSFDTSPIAF